MSNTQLWQLLIGTLGGNAVLLTVFLWFIGRIIDAQKETLQTQLVALQDQMILRFEQMNKRLTDLERH